jgi:plastocyanin
MNRLLAAMAGSVVLAAACAGGAPAASSAGVPAGAAQEIRIVARGIAFVPSEVGAPAGVPLHVVLDNEDDGIPHGLALMGAMGSTKLGATDLVIGPATVEMDVPGLVPGVYQLLCEIHPTMVTTLTVGD